MVLTGRKEYSRKYYELHREEHLRRSRERYYANREKRLAQCRLYNKTHPDVVRKKDNKYNQNNREKRRESCRQWYHRNILSERIRVKKKNHNRYSELKDKVLADNKKWRDNNKDKIVIRDMKRRALLKGARINLRKINEWVSSIKSRLMSRCYYCEQLIPSSEIHFDHIVPLSKGGPHSVDNLCVSCSRCNLSKKDKSISGWVRLGQQVFEL